MINFPTIKYIRHNRFWWYTKRQTIHFIPYLHISMDSVLSMHSIGVEIGWLTKWASIQWDFSIKPPKEDSKGTSSINGSEDEIV